MVVFPYGLLQNSSRSWLSALKEPLGYATNKWSHYQCEEAKATPTMIVNGCG